MTSLIAWVGVDSRGPASMYMASDSRLSASGVVWDHGRKVFATQTSGDLIGYCGEALFPSHVLGEVCAAIEVGIWHRDDDASARAETLCEMLEDAACGYPRVNLQATEFIYSTRQRSGMSAEFACFRVRPNAVSSQERVQQMPMPAESGILACLGSGANIVRRHVDRWMSSGQAGGRTSRAVFAGFCDAVGSHEDQQTGGSPQLCGLFRQGPARSLGVAWEDRRYLLGLDVTNHPSLQVEWRNRRFERVDDAGVLLPDAQRQPRPKFPK